MLAEKAATEHCSLKVFDPQIQDTFNIAIFAGADVPHPFAAVRNRVCQG